MASGFLDITGFLEAVQVAQGGATKVLNSTLVRRINLQLAKLSQMDDP
ncbi:hypothetical protein Golax_015275, partial [Gossypium laxum]|nr:hypothetical protein [Gossypium laxum]